ncbi:MAG: SDR family NAD(P)-dependent oxidoreductase, partial [Solirubrobacteraceae bacterium]
MKFDYFNPHLLAGKTALVTGGATGIGHAMARGLGAVGARVVIASRNSDRLQAAVEALRADGVDASWTALDVRDADAVERTVATIVEDNGGLDILVNNAGGTFPKKAEELTPNGFRAIVDV